MPHTEKAGSLPAVEKVDILEDNLLRRSPLLLEALLKDQTTSTPDQQRNIFWATDDYAHLGEDFQYNNPILPHLITGENGHVIMPRVMKERELQTARTKERAEVFTPSWLCNRMNNAADEEWFGRADVFNTSLDDHSWQPTTAKITFPKGKSWKKYVENTRLEITCGEAPFLVSRYDTTTGAAIPISHRIGMLDRKLRVVSENAHGEGEWLEWALTALKSIYGYEWQGDNLLLARENILYTFIDYYQERFSSQPPIDTLMQATKIITWNVWQMDGLKCVVPGSCHDEVVGPASLFGDEEEQRTPCPGCINDNIHRHNGKKCRIMDWKKEKPILFTETMK